MVFSFFSLQISGLPPSAVAFTFPCLSEIFMFQTSLILTLSIHCSTFSQSLFLFPSFFFFFNRRSVLCSLALRFSPRWLLSNKAVKGLRHSSCPQTHPVSLLDQGHGSFYPPAQLSVLGFVGCFHI